MTQTNYDGFGDVVGTTDANSHSTTVTRAPFGLVAGTTDPLGNMSYLKYDNRGHPSDMRDPDRGHWTYSYDGLGHLVSQTDANGQVTSFSYDALGRAIQRAAPGQTDSWTYEVLSGPATGCSATLSCGRLVQASNGLGYSRAESYDSLARPSQSAITIDGITYTVGTSYDSSGRVASVAYPTGTDVTGTNRFTVGYSYNSTGYLSSLTNANSSTTLWTQNTADAYLNSLQETAGNGVVTNKSYDAMERPATIQTGSSGGVQNFAYHWDTDGNLSNRVDSLQSYTEAFTYDPLNRLTGASQSGGAGASATFNYDYIGNLTTKSDVGTYTYPAAGAAQPHAVQSITGSVNNGAGAVAGEVTNPTYQYDANGNMIKGAGRTITYNAANLPLQIDNGVNIDSFTYDSEHRRYKEAVQNWTYISMPGSGLGFPIPASTNGRQVYIQTGQGIIAYATITAPGGVTWTSYFGTSEIKGVYQVSGGVGAYSYYHHDHLGSITAITTAAGAVLERTSFDAWGKLRSVSGAADPTNSLTSNALFTYTGQENLSKVALLHYNARAYDPQIGRFNGADPLTTDTYSTQGWNRYAYVGNNPLNSTDPTGQIIVCVSNASVASSYNNDEITLTESTSTSCSDDGRGNPFLGGGAVIGAGNGQGGVAPGTSPTTPEEIVVTGKRKSTPSVPPLPYFFPQYLYYQLFPFYVDDFIGTFLPQSNQKACNATLVNIGNKLAGIAAKASDASVDLEEGGLVVAGAGAVTAQPELVGGGLAVTATGGVMGMGAGGTQIVAGLFQGFGGAGYSNALTGFATLGGSALIGRVITGPAVAGYRTVSQRATDSFLGNTATVTGGGYDAVTSLFDSLSPQQKTCP